MLHVPPSPQCRLRWDNSDATIAVTTTSFSFKTGLLYDADIELNAARQGEQCGPSSPCSGDRACRCAFILTTLSSPPCEDSMIPADGGFLLSAAPAPSVMALLAAFAFTFRQRTQVRAMKSTWARIGLGAVVLIGAVIAAGAAYQSIASARLLKRHPPKGELIDVGGRRLHLWCAGNGSPAVIFEHSGLGNSASWERVLPRVADVTRACAYDRAGMGWSDPAEEPLTAEALAKDLDTLLDRANVSPPHVIVPASIGGLVAELYARTRPEKVAGVVFVDAVNSEVLRRAPDVFKDFARDACAAKWPARFGLMRLADPFGIGEDEESVALTYKTATWASLCSLMSAVDDSAKQLEVAPPLRRDLEMVVMIAGKPDGLFPAGQEDRARKLQPLWNEAQIAFAQRSTRSRVLTVADSGHLIMHERPDPVVSSILTLVEQARAAPVAPAEAPAP